MLGYGSETWIVNLVKPTGFRVDARGYLLNEENGFMVLEK